MFSTDYLKAVADALAAGSADAVSLAAFHAAWARGARPNDPVFVPFSLGSIAGWLSIGMTLTKEKWDDLLPLTPMSESSWGLRGTEYVDSRNPNPSVRDVMRRMRNAMSHGQFHIHVPATGATAATVMDDVSVAFWDVNPNNPRDTFRAEVTLRQAAHLIRSFQGTVHRSLRGRSPHWPPVA